MFLSASPEIQGLNLRSTIFGVDIWLKHDCLYVVFTGLEKGGFNEDHRLYDKYMSFMW